MKNQFKTGLLMLTIFCTLTTSAQVPVLSSYPSATNVIFLDFDGHTVAGTSWNYNGPIYCAPATIDNAQITTVFNSVAEDYRPFGINVTTDSTRYFAAPANRRTRVIISATSAWYGNGAGGVSFVGSFIWGDNTPCFVFSSLLGNNINKVSEAAAHEAGHTLGLYHQSTYDANCVKLSDYNYGTLAGPISWAPIMGVGYGKVSTTWYDGPNSYGCSNYQSDMDILMTRNGVSLRPDDVGETFATAPASTFTNNAFTIDGTIGTATDKDMFKFTMVPGKRLVLNAAPANAAGGNLEVEMKLYNSATTLIGTYNTPLGVDARIDTMLNAGTYYIRIDGVANANTPEYGSLGEYTVSAVQSIPTTLPLRQLVISGQLSGDKHQLNWLIDADEQVVEQILEVSTDGRNFIPVTNSDISARSFLYKPYVTTTALYRMNVTFDNGHQYYSNIIALKGTSTVVKPKLVTNLIITNTIIVTSPGNYNYAVYDFNGKTVRKGQLTNGLNNIDATGISSGMYMIRFANNAEEWNEKLVRQ